MLTIAFDNDQPKTALVTLETVKTTNKTVTATYTINLSFTNNCLTYCTPKIQAASTIVFLPSVSNVLTLEL